MAGDRQRDGGRCAGGAAGDLLGAILYGPLGLEFADMKTIIEMAREVGIDWHRHWNDDESNRLERFAELVRADEREAFANDWETLHGYDKHGVADTIRARGNT